MEKMWAGRFEKALDKMADDFNSSLRIDKRMYRQDIRGSMAHAAMLAAQGIINQQDEELILDGLAGILADMDSGVLVPVEGEDIHMFVEAELTRRIGDAGKRLHTARSRNDQVALDVRLYLRERVQATHKLVLALAQTLLDKAEANRDTIMPGYTHLQRAQPVNFAHHLMAYVMMLLRDAERFRQAADRMNVSPLGSCALAGTTYPIDRDFVAAKLGMNGCTVNSMDGVSDRDFCVELASCCAMTMMHLSRLAEEVILWCSWEFRFVELDDSFTTGSSIMPQKKNADIAELVRGKTGRVYGDLITLLTLLKGLPLAYNKDMQEDKEAIFDAFDTLDACLEVTAPMLQGMKVRGDNMLSAAQKGFINATDLADYLVKKGMPFRTAYKLVGQTVALCIRENTVLDELPLDVYRQIDPAFEEDLYQAIDLKTCVGKRNSPGGPGPESLQKQFAQAKERIEYENDFY